MSKTSLVYPQTTRPWWLRSTSASTLSWCMWCSWGDLRRATMSSIARPRARFADIEIEIRERWGRGSGEREPPERGGVRDRAKRRRWEGDREREWWGRGDGRRDATVREESLVPRKRGVLPFPIPPMRAPDGKDFIKIRDYQPSDQIQQLKIIFALKWPVRNSHLKTQGGGRGGRERDLATFGRIWAWILPT